MTKDEHTSCPMDKMLRMLMGPWTTYILWLVRNNEVMRFGQLRKQIPGISAKMLTERLRMLESEGVIHREHEPTIPPKVSYSLTDKGRELNKVLNGLCDLAKKWDEEDNTRSKPARAKKAA